MEGQSSLQPRTALRAQQQQQQPGNKAPVAPSAPPSLSLEVTDRRPAAHTHARWAAVAAARRLSLPAAVITAAAALPFTAAIGVQCACRGGFYSGDVRQIHKGRLRGALTGRLSPTAPPRCCT